MLHISDLTKKFGEVIIFQNLNLKVSGGEIIGIYGSSGSGKTTLFNLLSGLDTWESGEIYLDSRLLNSLNSTERSKLGIVSDPFNSESLDLDQSVYQNLKQALNSVESMSPTDVLLNFLRYGKSSDKEDKIDKMLQELDLSGFKSILCRELDSMTQHLVKLAKIFLQDWKVLIFDGLSEDLKTAEKQIITSHMHELKSHNRAVVLIENDLEFLQNTADRVYEMSQGALKQL